MKKVFLACLIIILTTISSCCYRVSCGPCIGKPSILYMNNHIIQFDTSQNNFKTTDIDTLFLFENENSVDLKTPDDTFFNNTNSVNFSGENLRLNNYVSNQSMTRFIKIDSLQFNTIIKGEACCSCDKYEVTNININDIRYFMNQLPILIKK